jgi:hypothetical protein
VTGGYLEVIRADGRIQRHELAAERVTVGGGPSAAVHIPDAPELEPLHLLLAPREDGCWVSAARTARTEARHGGRLFENGLVPWGGEVDVGAVTFRLARAEASPREKRRLAPLVRKVLMLAVCLWLAGQIFGRPPDGPPRTDAPAPALFAGEPAACPGDGPAHAEESLEAAAAKAERYVFSPQDGVEAVRLYAQAADCFTRSGDDEAAGWAGRQGRELEARVEEDYRSHLLRLERALDQRNYRSALREARLVAEYVRQRDGEYADWLIRVEGVLAARVAKGGKK